MHIESVEIDAGKHETYSTACMFKRMRKFKYAFRKMECMTIEQKLVEHNSVKWKENIRRKCKKK